IRARPLLAARAKIGVSVLDLTSGTELFAHGADQGMTLASNAKLLTSVAALGTLGGGFRWRTSAFIADRSLDETTGVVTGDLYLRAHGDPTLNVNDLRAIATEIAAHGVRTVNGNLSIDATYFDDVVDPPHFQEQPKERAYFRAPVASFGVSRSAFLVNVIGEPGGGAKVWIEPDAGDHIKLAKVQVISVMTGRTRIKVDVKPKKDTLEIEVVGQIRLSDGHWWLKRRVDDPLRYAAEVFKRALAEKGVKITKKPIKLAPVPINARSLVAHDSEPLSSVIRDMNKASDNYMAESVLKTLGAETRATPAPATWADGVAAVQAFLARLGLPPGTYRYDNGSGLFAATEVSPRQLVTVLRGAYADYRIGPDLVGSLPVGGTDGTLARRWHDSAARGRVRAKTGTLAAVTSLSGYVGVDGAHPIAFSIVVNDIPTGQKGPARAMADDMLDAIVAYLEAQGAK
ncbi:MAG TPA: D-alanyl-D-alanine carboxypeptidase/D-alanyl-D-alanine-endopeptidase, partial [Nannocystaceae bacterium]|nr:D-alanyl-D-alanine carboxypeptidase/D-alanyl-D-alanine-endopeptidase [Nannocystaceae bacterium]